MPASNSKAFTGLQLRVLQLKGGKPAEGTEGDSKTVQCQILLEEGHLHIPLKNKLCVNASQRGDDTMDENKQRSLPCDILFVAANVLGRGHTPYTAIKAMLSVFQQTILLTLNRIHAAHMASETILLTLQQIPCCP